ncbi:MAG: MarR family transcriptional regulator [Phycisphaerales bacterium]|nr:MarR family transcriptional regulator [Phycisphaerales bacterium]
MNQVDRILEQWGRVRPDLDVTPMGLTGRLKRIARILEREMEPVFAAHGLNLASFDVLATLLRSGEPFRLSPGELIENSMVTSGTMTNRIDQLVKGGLVERVPNPEDGRSVLIALTKQGRRVIDRAIEDHVQNLHRLTSGLSDNAFTRLDRSLVQYLEVLENDS